MKVISSSNICIIRRYFKLKIWRTKNIFVLIFIVLLAATGIFLFTERKSADDNCFVSYVADVKKQKLQQYCKDDQQ